MLLRILLLLRHNIIKRWRHINIKAMERVQLVDQVRIAGESVDAAHIDEKRSKRRVELRPISFSDPKRGRGVVENLQPRFGSSSRASVVRFNQRSWRCDDLHGDRCVRTDRWVRVAWSRSCCIHRDCNSAGGFLGI